MAHLGVGGSSSVTNVTDRRVVSRVNFYSFHINLPIGGLVILIILFVFESLKGSVSEEAHNASYKEKLLQMDLIGAALILTAVVCLLLAL